MEDPEKAKAALEAMEHSEDEDAKNADIIQGSQKVVIADQKEENTTLKKQVNNLGEEVKELVTAVEQAEAKASEAPVRTRSRQGSTHGSRSNRPVPTERSEKKFDLPEFDLKT